MSLSNIRVRDRVTYGISKFHGKFVSLGEFIDANLINTELERYLKVSKEDIQRVANKYFVPSNRVVLYYLPKENG